MKIKREWVKYGAVEARQFQPAKSPVDLTAETMQEHKSKIIKRMKEREMDVLFVYADREHGGNFGYLTGFEPRFEESVLVLHQDGKAFLMLGNESLRMEAYSRIEAEGVHVPLFSLPNQPMQGYKEWKEILTAVRLKKERRVGVAGWKLFTCENGNELFDIPAFILEAIRQFMDGTGKIENAADLFIHPQDGARVIMNANEIAHYEFGASLASYCVNNVMKKFDVGERELDLANELSAYGQPITVQNICATGERFTNAVVSPRDKYVKRGDRFTVTMGLRGGLTCRVGYAAGSADELPTQEKEYMERVVIPYYQALAEFYTGVRIGATAGTLYQAVEEIILQGQCKVQLNPGHYTASEEWMSSPMYPDSEIKLKSGMMMQADIIVHVPGYGGCNAEDGIALGDEKLRSELRQTYDETWKRIQKRREYMQEILGLDIGEELLPMSELCGYVRPYLLEKQKAMYINNNTTGGTN